MKNLILTLTLLLGFGVTMAQLGPQFIYVKTDTIKGKTTYLMMKGGTGEIVLDVNGARYTSDMSASYTNLSLINKLFMNTYVTNQITSNNTVITGQINSAIAANNAGQGQTNITAAITANNSAFVTPAINSAITSNNSTVVTPAINAAIAANNTTTTGQINAAITANNTSVVNPAISAAITTNNSTVVTPAINAAIAANNTTTTGQINSAITANNSAFVTPAINAAVSTLNATIAALKLGTPYTGTTAGAGASTGTYTVTYTTPYAVIPNVQPVIRNQSNPNQQAILTASTVNGFTVTTVQRNAVTLLAVEVLLAATTPVNGLTVDVLVTPK